MKLKKNTHGSNKAKNRCGHCKENGDPEYMATSKRNNVERKLNVKRKRNRTNVNRKVISEQV